MTCIAAVDDLAGDNELVHVIDGALHIVARNGLVALAQKSCVRIGLRQLPLIPRVQPIDIRLCTRALGHQRRYFRAKIAAIPLTAAVLTVGSLSGFRRIIGFESLAVGLDLLV